MCNLATDFGAEFSTAFTRQLNALGINHSSRIPRRSQSQGNAEVAIRILKTTLTKVCAGQLTHKDWDLCLPLAITSINQSHPRGAPLSRQKLYYSPFIFDNQPLILDNPVKTQTQSYQYLNKQRITALQSSKHKKHDQLSSVHGMAVGMYVKLDSKVGNKSINICPA